MAQRIVEIDSKRLDALRAALVEGERSGPPEGFDVDAFIAAKKATALRREARPGRQS